MSKIKRPKSTTLTLDKRIQILLEMGVAADKRTDYIVATLSALVGTNLPHQDDALNLIYDTLIEMGTPFHVKLWRWVKGKRCRTES